MFLKKCCLGLPSKLSGRSLTTTVTTPPRASSMRVIAPYVSGAFIIGRNGTRLHEIVDGSGARVLYSRNPIIPLDCVFDIRGTHQQIAMAFKLFWMRTAKIYFTGSRIQRMAAPVFPLLESNTISAMVNPVNPFSTQLRRKFDADVAVSRDPLPRSTEFPINIRTANAENVYSIIMELLSLASKCPESPKKAMLYRPHLGMFMSATTTLPYQLIYEDPLGGSSIGAGQETGSDKEAEPQPSSPAPSKSPRITLQRHIPLTVEQARHLYASQARVLRAITSSTFTRLVTDENIWKKEMPKTVVTYVKVRGAAPCIEIARTELIKLQKWFITNVTKPKLQAQAAPSAADKSGAPAKELSGGSAEKEKPADSDGVVDKQTAGPLETEVDSALAESIDAAVEEEDTVEEMEEGAVEQGDTAEETKLADNEGPAENPSKEEKTG